MVFVKNYSGWTVAASKNDLKANGIELAICEPKGDRRSQPTDNTKIVDKNAKGSEPGTKVEPGGVVGVILRPPMLAPLAQ
jgi:hypothetical protein